MAAIRTMSGTRVRFQRVRDAKFFGGWTIYYDGNAIVVKPGSDFEPQAGDQFFFQLYGVTKNLLFRAECLGTDNGMIRFRIIDRPREIIATEEARQLLQGVTCAIDNEYGGSFVEILDASPSGLGIAMPYDLQKSANLGLLIQCDAGEIRAQGTVMNCRVLPSGYGFRIGIKLKIADRMMLGRWKSLFSEAA